MSSGMYSDMKSARRMLSSSPQITATVTGMLQLLVPRMLADKHGTQWVAENRDPIRAAVAQSAALLSDKAVWSEFWQRHDPAVLVRTENRLRDQGEEREPELSDIEETVFREWGEELQWGDQ